MSDFFDSFVSTGTSIVNGVIDNINIIREPAFENYNAAQRVFGTAGEMGFSFYNLPKFKNSFIIEFVLTPFAKNFIKTQLPDTHTDFDVNNVSCFVKDVTLPSFSFSVETVNQYNKKRLVTGDIVYKPSNVVFYDTVDGAGYLLMDAYRKFYYGDFFDKNPQSYRNDVLSTPENFNGLGGNWGRSVMNNGNYDNQYFFKSINIYEIDNETYTVHNMINVFIEDIQLETKSMESEGDPSLLSLTMRYEACNNFGPEGYLSIGVPTMEIAQLITDTEGLGVSGFFKYFGELDDKTKGITTVGKIIRAGTSVSDIISSAGDILRGDITPDTIRNIGSAVTRGANAIGLGSIVSSASSKFGLGNILGDF